VSVSDGDPPDRIPPPISEADALKYVGKYILVGITQEDAFGNITDKYEIHGVIELVASNGITISLRGVRQGESYVIPPALANSSPIRTIRHDSRSPRPRSIDESA
jgi:hypothetical protein